MLFFFFFSSRRRHTRCSRDWSSDVCSSDLAMASIGFGLALSMTGGVPVYGMPSQFGATLGFGKLLGVPVPVYVTVVVILAMYVLLNWTRIGRYFYAIGGNIKASALSGISTRSYLFLAYVLCGFLASLGGVM